MENSASNTDEKVLIRDLAAGDIEAFQQLFHRYEQQLKQYAFRLTKSKFVVDEIIQEVFIKVWENRRNINPDRSFSTYLYRMVRNRAFNYLRDAMQHEDCAGELWQDMVEAGTQADHHLISAEYDSLIHKILEDLPPQKRSIYLLSRYEGKTNVEIAELLNISTKTVENHLWKTLQIIKSRLKPHLNISFTWLPVTIILSDYIH